MKYTNVSETNYEALRHLSRATDYIDMDDPRFTNKAVFERMKRGLFTDSYSKRYVIGNRDLKVKMEDAMKHLLSTEEIAILVKEAVEATGAVFDENELLIHEHFNDLIYRRFALYNGNMVLFGSLGIDQSDFAATVVGNPTVAESWITPFTENYTHMKMIQFDQLLGFSQQGPEVKQTHFTVEESKERLGHDDFYPFIEGGIDKLVEDYRKSKGNILLLIGDRGLGKTTLIRTLLSKLGRERNVLCDNEVTIMNPAFMVYIQSLSDATICIEDADNLLAKREDQNHQMSALLNYTDGVIKNDTSMILSTNLPSLNRVDQALFRPGRTFRVIQFRKLNYDEAMKARAALDLPVIEPEEFDKYTRDGVVSLATVLNWEDHINNDSEAMNHSFGFGQ